MSQLTLTVLGQFAASLNNQPITKYRTNKVQALLIYLTVEAVLNNNLPQSRERIADLLWPGLPEKSARTNLRQIVYQLRRQFPELYTKAAGEKAIFIVSNRHHIQINPEVRYTLDVALFIQNIAAVQEHEHTDLVFCSDCQNALQTAVSLYRDDFLADFYLADSNVFEEWAGLLREQFQRQMLDALDTLTISHMRQNAYSHAEHYVHQQLKIDNLRENAVRQLMEILSRSGRANQAIAEYEKFRRVLQNELGMSPMEKTSAMAKQIQAGDLNLATSTQQVARGYELREEIGMGSFGTVYRAIQSTVGREVAVKIIRAKYANHPSFIRSFEIEAHLVAQMEHPHIVPLYDYWREPDGAYLVMRWLRNGSLEQSLEQHGAWSLDAAMILVDQIAAALSVAHRKNVVHRDIKPANILLDEDGNAYLSDFGIAKDAAWAAQIAQPGDVIGSPAYISPEQIMRKTITPATDLYSFGLVIYHVLTGQYPFADASLAALVHCHLNEPLPFIHRSHPQIPPAIDEVIHRATVKDPLERFPDALSLAKAFRQAIGNGHASANFAIPSPITTLNATLPNPYKGLLAFQEADANQFFGRQTFVERLKGCLAESRFLAVVGPSGSGKSSVVKAGLLPELRQGVLPGSDDWFIIDMMPGTHPLEELDAALLRIAVNPPASLIEPLQKDVSGLSRVLKRVLPQGHGVDRPQLLLIVDQFEELFTLVTDEMERTHFIDSLLAAVSDRNSQLHLIITLRADFYDRPLRYPVLGEFLRQHTELVLPLTPAELKEAIIRPARHVGIAVEDSLVTNIINDVQDQPGALPLVQYALAALFERRQRDILTQVEYLEIGGVLGALGRRAEYLYTSLDEPTQAIARQLFLRLVTLGEGNEDTRRRVLLTELESISNIKSSITDFYGRHRLLTFDRDPATRIPTVEVAHEALLREWPRLRLWLDESRDEVRLQRLLATAVVEWNNARRNNDFLLRGSRLDQFDEWARQTDIALAKDEQDYLQASLDLRQQRLLNEEARQKRELETARQLAHEQGQRAEEQARAAKSLRQRAYFLAGALVIAAILAIVAITFGRQSAQNALNETNARATAETETVIRAGAEAAALQSQADAESQTQFAIARELAASALANLDVDPELSILLSLQSLSTNFTPQGEDVLHQSLLTSRQRFLLDHGPNADIVFDVSYSGDGRYLATVSASRFVSQDENVTVQVWDTNSGVKLLSIPAPAGSQAAAISPNNQWLALQSDGYDVIVLDLSASLSEGSAQIAQVLSGHTAGLAGMSFSTDSRLLATVGFDSKVNLWQPETGEWLYSLDVPVEFYGAYPIFSPDNVYLAVRATDLEDTTPRLFDVASGELLLSFPETPAANLAFREGGKQLVTVGLFTPMAQVWDIEASIATGEHQELYSFAVGGIGHATINKDGTLLAFTEANPTIWRLGDDAAEKIMTLRGESSSFFKIKFSPDDTYVAAGSTVYPTTFVWDISLAGNSEALVLEQESSVYRIDLSPDGSQLATDAGNEARIWGLPAAEQLLNLVGHEGFLMDVRFSPDGSRLATASIDNTARIWDLDSGEQLALLEGHGEGNVGGFFPGVLSVDFSPDGELLATGGADGAILFYDATTYEPLLSRTILIDRDGSGVTKVRFSPDTNFLAVTTDCCEGLVRVYDLQNGEIVFEENDVNRLWGVEFSPDGKSIVTTRRGGRLVIWEFESGAELFSVEVPGQTSTFAFNDEGSLLAVSGTDGARLWDVASGQLLLHLGKGLAEANAVIFSADGSQLIVGHGDGAIRFYYLRLDELIAQAEARVTRSLTAAECEQYLQVASCPNEP